MTIDAKTKVKGQLVQIMEWKHTDATNYNTFSKFAFSLAQSVITQESASHYTE